MGKRGPKSKFTVLLARMKLVKIMVLLGTETFPVTVHIEQETKPFEDVSAIVAGKSVL
jgi:hypothetical protein